MAGAHVARTERAPRLGLVMPVTAGRETPAGARISRYGRFASVSDRSVDRRRPRFPAGCGTGRPRVRDARGRRPVSATRRKMLEGGSESETAFETRKR